MNDWNKIVDEYGKMATPAGTRLALMHSLVSSLAVSDVASELSPSMSHEALVLSEQRGDYRYYPSIVVVPGDTTFEITLTADQNMEYESARAGPDEVKDKVQEFIEKCMNLKSGGPGRGFPLLCDVAAILVEKKLRCEQTMFVRLDRDGSVRTKGCVTTREHTDDLLIFSVPVSVFDRVMYFAKSGWLKRTGVFGRHGGKVTSVLTVGFRLIDDTEMILSFVSQSEEANAPDDILEFVEVVIQSLARHCEAELRGGSDAT